MNRYSAEGLAKAVEYLKQALARDPENALAWAELGRAYAVQATCYFIPPAEGHARAKEATNCALSLDPDLPEGVVRMGWLQLSCDLDFRGAEASFKRALAIAPGNAYVLNGAAAMAVVLGRFEEALALTLRSLEQDPLSAPTYHNLSSVLYAVNRFEEAEAALRRELDLAPEARSSRSHLSLTMLARGQGEEALAEVLREPEDAFRLWAVAIIHHAMGHRSESDAALEQLTEKYAEDSAFQIAEVHGWRGDIDRAFEWLERAYAQRDGGLTELKISARLRPLRGDPRWRELLKKLHLED